MSPLRIPVSRLTLPLQTKVYVSYLTLEYFISYLPYALLAKALSSGLVPGVDWPVGSLVLPPAAALGRLLAMPILLGVSGWWRLASELPEPVGASQDDHLHTAALLQQTAQKRLAEKFL